MIEPPPRYVPVRRYRSKNGLPRKTHALVEPTPKTRSWGPTTKLVVALTFVAVAAALLIKFEFVLAPLGIAIILAYLFQPVADLLQRTGMSWRLSVTILYLVILLVVIGLVTWGGVGLVQQVQNAVGAIQNALQSLPDLLKQLSGTVIAFGPLRLDFSQTDLTSLSGQLLNMVQPLLSRTGTLLSAVAGKAASFVGWTLFVLLVSYFILIEAGGLRTQLIKIEIPTYREDFAHLGRELGRIWNAFLRGQAIIFTLAVLVYTIVLSILGVRYAFGLALLAGLARFVPYVGPAVNWFILFLVSYLQPYKLFDMQPLYYSLLVLGIALLIDQVFDNFVSPRILADALKVHPAAVLVAAIVAANLLGVVGVVIAAPILATLMLMGRYTMRKMLDLDPWPAQEVRQPPPPIPGARIFQYIRQLWRKISSPPPPVPKS